MVQDVYAKKYGRFLADEEPAETGKLKQECTLRTYWIEAGLVKYVFERHSRFMRHKNYFFSKTDCNQVRAQKHIQIYPS